MFSLTWYAQHEPQSKPINIASYGATQQGMGLHHAGVSAGESLWAIQHPSKKPIEESISISHAACHMEDSHSQSAGECQGEAV